MRVLSAGAGAVGGFLAARLADAGDGVAVLVRPARADGLRRDALRVREGSATGMYRPRVRTARELKPEFDLVVLAVKSDAIDSAIDDVALAVGPSTAVAPFLNGMRHVEPLVSRFGSAVLGGVLRIATERADDGAIRVLVPMFVVEVGELAGPSSERDRGAVQGSGRAGHHPRRHRRRHVDEMGLHRLDRCGHIADARLRGRDRRRPRRRGILAVDPGQSYRHGDRRRAPGAVRCAHRHRADPHDPRLPDNPVAIA